MFCCEVCQKSFLKKQILVRHVKSCHNAEKVKCEKCEAMFSRKDNLNHHMKMKHPLTVSMTSKGIDSKINCATKREFSTLQQHPSTSGVQPKKMKSTVYRRCLICEEDIEERNWTQHQRKNTHKEKARQALRENVSFIEGAFKN